MPLGLWVPPGTHTTKNAKSPGCSGEKSASTTSDLRKLHTSKLLRGLADVGGQPLQAHDGEDDLRKDACMKTNGTGPCSRLHVINCGNKNLAALGLPHAAHGELGELAKPEQYLP